MTDRAIETFCACDIAEHMDGRLDPKPARLAAGVLLTADCGVRIGVGRGPIRTRDGVGGSMFGLGSSTWGGGYAVVGPAVFCCENSGLRNGTAKSFLGSGCAKRVVFRGLTSTVSNSGVRRGTMLFQSFTTGAIGEPGDGG
jgi:hypothetical protein